MNNTVNHLANGDFAIKPEGQPAPGVTRYVMMVAVDPSTGFVIGITKKKGPKFLLEKLTFPGGKIEAGETVAFAAHRELLEETGVDVPEESFKLVSCDKGEGYELNTLVCVTDKVLHARALEEEPVWHLAAARHLDYCVGHPERYAPDFREKLLASLEVAGVTLACTACA